MSHSRLLVSGTPLEVGEYNILVVVVLVVVVGVLLVAGGCGAQCGRKITVLGSCLAASLMQVGRPARPGAAAEAA